MSWSIKDQGNLINFTVKQQRFADENLTKTNVHRRVKFIQVMLSHFSPPPSSLSDWC